MNVWIDLKRTVFTWQLNGFPDSEALSGKKEKEFYKKM